MPNIANKPIRREDRFIEDLTRLMTGWGVPETAARLYGYLLLSAEPAGLDRIAADLEIGKTSASVAARQLESWRLVRRLSERGSKRLRYEASDTYDVMLAERNRLLDAMAALFRAGAQGAASDIVADRLGEMADFYRVAREATESALDEWRAHRKP